MDQFLQGLKVLLKTAGPALSTLLCILVSAISLPVPGIAQFFPSLGLASVFFWSLYRPWLVPYAVVFALGLVQDALTGEPLGMHVLIFLIMRIITAANAKLVSPEVFPTVWLGFMALSTALALLHWILASVYMLNLFFPLAAVVQWALTIAFYPLLHYLYLSLFDPLSDTTHAQ